MAVKQTGSEGVSQDEIYLLSHKFLATCATMTELWYRLVHLSKEMALENKFVHFKYLIGPLLLVL